MRVIQYQVAVSIDGFIAHSDGSHAGFAFEGEHVSDYLAALAGYTAVLMGRHTYASGLAQGVTNPYPGRPQFVFSRTLADSPDPAVTLVRDDATAWVREFRQTGEGLVYLCGGGVLAGQLLQAGLVDEVVLKQNPVVLGRGIPLFGAGTTLRALSLVEAKTYSNGVVRLHYRVGSD